MRTTLACLILTAGLLVGCDQSNSTQNAKTPTGGGSNATSGGTPPASMPSGSPAGVNNGAGGDPTHP